MEEPRCGVWLTRDEAQARVLMESRFSPRFERVGLRQCAGRVCAHDVLSRQRLPNTPSSRWDGVAVRFADFALGSPDTSGWREGDQYVFSNTGIGIPEGYDTVVRIEEVAFDDANRITFLHEPKRRGQLVVEAGSSLEEGALLASAGQTITPEIAALLAAGGQSEVEVFARPRVSFIPSGNELVQAGEPLPAGRNVETNSIMLEAKLRAWGAEPRILPIVRDNVALLVDALQKAIATSDIVILNGGSSKGSDDCAVPALERVATILSHAVLMGPGAHLSLSITRKGIPIVGLSGPSGGAECTADWYVKPLVDRYFGRSYCQPPHIRARLVAGIDHSQRSAKTGVYRAVRCIVAQEGEGFVAAPMAVLSQDVCTRYRGGNAFAFVAGDSLERGDEIEVELRYPYVFPPADTGLFDGREADALVL